MSSNKINWYKWLQCWIRRKHIFVCYTNKEGKLMQKCIRCGVERIPESSQE